MSAEASATGVALNGLLLACAQGNADAFKCLYRQTSSRVLSVIRRNVWNACEAEEVLQEVYVKVWRFSSSFEPNKSLAMTWITHVARNHAIDHLRHSSDRALHEAMMIEAEVGDQPWEPVDPGPQPQELMESRRAAVRMTASLLQLSRDQRLVLLMAFHQELTQTEIALRLGVPLGTVKSWMRRGLRALKASLALADTADTKESALARQHGEPAADRQPCASPVGSQTGHGARGGLFSPDPVAMAW